MKMLMEASKRKWKNLYHEQIKMGICYCYLCGKLIEKEEDFSLDHQQPKSRQGLDSPSNWKPCCRSCNHRKGALTYEEYQEWKRLEFLRNGGKEKTK